MNHNEIEEDEIDIHKIIVYLKRNLKTILLITFFVAVATAAYAYFLKPIYSSSVSIAFSDEKKSTLASIVPDISAGLSSALSNDKSALETVKLTLETRKFINSVIKDLDLHQHYFLEENFKKNEVYGFDNLKITLDIHDELYFASTEDTLYGETFEIQPIDNTHFLLKVDALDYAKKQPYNQEIKEKFFSLTVVKRGAIEEQSYFVEAHDKSLVADEVLENMQVAILSDNVLSITYNDTVAQRAKELVEAIAKSFIAYTLDKKTTELDQTLSFLDTQIAETKIVLTGAGDKLKSYQEKSNNFIPMDAGTTLYDTVIQKEEALKNFELQYQEVVNFKKSLKSNRLNTVSLLNSGINTSSIQSLIESFRADMLTLNEMQLQANNIEKSITSNPQLGKLIEKLNTQKKLLADLKFNFTAGHPQVEKASSDLLELENEIRAFIATNIKRLKQNQALTKKKISENIAMTQRNIRSKIKVLKEDLDEKHTLLQSLPEKDLTTQGLKRKFTLSENIYTFLLQKKMEFQISKASTIANTRIIEDPIVALKPIKPNKKLILIVGILVGLILGILFTAIRAMLDTKIRDASMVEELTDAPLYGILPLKENKRFFDEALRSIRTNLQFVLPHEQQCTTMLISSSVAGEGKTTVIAGLGEIIAQTGKKVLLMDLDLRKPRLYQELGKSNKVGMSHYLVGDLNFHDVIQPVNEHLDFFAAGAVPPNPSELLMSEKFDRTVKELMGKYDYILFDTAPIGSVIDANMILKHADILLLVVKANVAEKVYLENFNKLREEKHIKSAGVILNQVKLVKSDGYGYGYGYGYGHDYGYGDTQHKDA